MRLKALDQRAEQMGLYQGQSLSDARALCPQLVAREIDEVGLVELFGQFADWHSYASPIVEVHDDVTPYGDLMIDVTGVTHLFGGEAKMLTHVTERLTRLGFSVQAGLADTVGVAWAMSHFAPGVIVGAGDDSPLPWGRGCAAAVPDLPSPLTGEGGAERRMRVIGAAEQDRLHSTSGSTPPRPSPSRGGWTQSLPHSSATASLIDILSPLPVEALRLDPMRVSGLKQMGLKRVGQILGRERKPLQARFGTVLIARLDQILGLAPEKLVPRLPLPERQVERRFVDPIGLLEHVMATVSDLAEQMQALLEAEGLGAQTFHLFLYRVDHQLMHLPVNGARAMRDAKHVTRLYANRMERLSGEFDAGFGIEAMRLAVTSVSVLDAQQAGVFDLGDGVADLSLLYDRMASRLGPQAVQRTKYFNSHVPERAVQLEPVIARTDDDVLALDLTDVPARPQRLLPVPEQIEVMAEVPDGPPLRMVWRKLTYRIAKAAGPERIGVEWWQPGEGGLTRDYYKVEDAEGRRFWLYRDGLYEDETAAPRWFLHGVFS